ncbi:MAG: hypothetical protein HOL31_07835 [Candidatus Scalindua sp.]|jgi:hypothetical protein|nr:hypothetical protein [Candidatus Scalindua sp.]
MEPNIKWINTEGKILARGWSDTHTPYSRFPSRSKNVLSVDVWELSQQSAGLFICFESNSTFFYAKWILNGETLGYPHMPATSASGLDFYGQDTDGQWKWVGIGIPHKRGLNEVCINYGLDSKPRKYVLYLPLLNVVNSLFIGVDEVADFKFAEFSKKKPIVYYGTSIVHGIAASRAGSCHSSIIGRRIGYEVINLGFSGRGKMEIPIAELIAEIDCSLYIIDCLPNMEFDLIKDRGRKFFDKLIQLKPNTPILVVEDRTYSYAWAITYFRQRNYKSRTSIKQIFQYLREEYGDHIHYLEGDQLLGQDGEGTVDGSHPNDLGFFRMANILEEKVKSII